MGNKYRVAHVGTGYTGSIALRQVLRSPRLELVGHLVHSPEKVGRDSGELVGGPAVGVEAVDSFEDFLALDADCVSYFATISGRDGDDVIDLLLQCDRPGHPVRHARAAFVKHDQAAEGGKPRIDANQSGVFPREFDITDKAGYPH